MILVKAKVKHDVFPFQNLEVYNQALVFTAGVKSLLMSKDHKIDNITRDQLRRASVSIPLNIAEGSGRFTKPDRRNFVVIARGSVFECVGILDVFRIEETITQRQYKELFDTAEHLSKMLYAMIRKLE